MQASIDSDDAGKNHQRSTLYCYYGSHGAMTIQLAFRIALDNVEEHVLQHGTYTSTDEDPNWERQSPFGTWPPKACHNAQQRASNLPGQTDL